MAIKKISNEKIIAKLNKELADIDAKIGKLGDVVKDEHTRDRVGYKHLLVMKRQLKAMVLYSCAVGERITLLKNQTAK